jgi:hypothetical protein
MEPEDKGGQTSEEEPQPAVKSKTPSLVSNWLSQVGIIMALCSFVAVLALLYVDFSRGFSNPYMSLVTYQMVPGGLITGLLLIVIGVWREYRRRHAAVATAPPPLPRIDLNIPRHRKNFVTVVVIAFTFLVFSTVGVYRTFHFTESVEFCGLLCHSVMKPEYTLYQKSPHARVACTECHVGPGASWFVKSKISGVYQIYSTAAEKFSRPIPTPIDNLRPARETCEQCHWPQRFSGSVERVRTHFLADEQNSPWTIRLLLKVGGGDPSLGPVHGIHWHMSTNHKVEYVATDRGRQTIPWVRVTDEKGGVTIYESKGEKLKPGDITPEKIRLMDCIDCHNRPTHIYAPPVRSVNTSMSLGRLDRSVPFLKKNAVQALVDANEKSKTEAEALAAIEKKLKADYAQFPDQGKVQTATHEIQRIFRETIFPEMKANWNVYPDNIGHSLWPGCIRCHEGEHSSADGKVISHDCNTCHIIIAQGPGLDPKALHAEGLEFDHPGGDIGKEPLCGNCHSGALAQ